MKFAIPLMAAVLLLNCGCAFFGNNYTAPEIYDSVQDIAVCDLAADRLRVSNESGADRRFLYRGKNSRMTFDEFNLWLLDPELLISRALKSVFVKRSKKAADISCTIDRFEFDIVNNCAILKLSVDISRAGRQKSFVCDEKEKFSSGSSSSAASAMNKCIKSALEKICAEYKSFSGKAEK